MVKVQIYFTKKIKLLAIVFILLSSTGFVYFQTAEAATGINSQINFQGKVVNKTAGTNVTNGDYDFTFRLYDAASGGSLLWTENHTGVNDVTVTDGIFRVALGSITSLSSVDFNSDSIYLDITFNGEAMGSRVRFASVPYAFNAEKVNGLTVTDNGGNTLSIAANKTFTVSNTILLSGTDSTSFVFPSTSGGTVIVNNISGQSIAGALNLTGASGNLDIAGVSGLNFSGVSGDITFANGEKIDNDVNGTIAVTGSLSSSGLITAGTGLTLTTGPITLGGATGSGLCLQGGASASWGSCGSGGGSSNWVLNSGTGIISPINNTLDLLVGGTASTSAKFSILNMVGSGTPTASVSAQTGTFLPALVLGGDGSIQSVRNNSLTIGGSTTGNIQFKPGNSSSSLFLNSAGIVSVGTTNPSTTAKFQVEQTKTDTSGFVLAMNYNYLIANPGGASTAEYVATRNLAEVANGNAQNFTGASIIGLYNQASHRGTQTISTALGVQGIIKIDNTGTITNGRAFNSLGQMNAAGAITNYSGFYASNPANSGGGTYGAAYGLYIENQTSATNDYGIYVAGADTNALWIDAGTSRFDGTIDAQGDILDTTGNLTLNDATDISGLLTVSNGLTLSGGGAITLGGSTGSGQCLTGGASASWGSCGSGGSGVNLLGQGNGLTWIGNITTDFAIGGTSTSSAKFVFGGSNAGTPTATFSGDLILNNKPTTSVADMQKWTQMTGTAGTIGGGATTAIASISASVVYNGSLYVGTNKANGAEIYRYDGINSTWTKVSNATAGTIASGGTANIDMVSSMTVWNGYLYIGTTEPNAAEVYRYDGTTTWTKVSQTTAGTIRSGGTAAIDGIPSMVVYGGKLWIGTAEGAKAEIYRYENGTTWIIINTTAGLFVTTNTVNVDAISSMVAFQGSLYFIAKKLNDTDFMRYQGITGGSGVALAMNAAGTTGSYNVYNTGSGAAAAITGFDDGQLTVYAGKIIIGLSNYGSNSEIIAWNANETVAQSNSFIRYNSAAGTIKTGGTSGIDSITAMTIYGGRLYVGTGEPNSAQIYRYDGSLGDWTVVSSNTAGQINGGGTTGIDAISTLISFNHNSLFAGILEGTATQGYMYQSSIDQSYALKFNAANSQAGGEQNGQENLGSIFFVASLSANLNNKQGNTGAFIFSHNLVTNNGSYDVAEDYPTRDHELEPGDLVSVDVNERGFVNRSKSVYDSGVIGVYSESPALRLSQQSEEIDGGKVIPVALAGRVPVKVSTENGPIKNGDYLAASSKPGIAMKAKKAGVVIGVAMSSFDGEGIGKVTTFIKSNSYNGSTAETFASIDPESSDFVDQVLTQLMNTQSDGKSSVVTDRVIAGLEVITPKIIVDTLIAKNIRAENIDLPEDFWINAFRDGGLEIENSSAKEINELKSQIAVLNAQIEVATVSAKSSQEKLMESINAKLTRATESATVPQNSLYLSSLNSDGLNIFEGSVRIKGNGLFENMLTVIDTLTSNDLIVNGFSTFFGKTVFKDQVEFEKTVAFNSDTGGEVVIKKDQRKIEVKFDQEFDQAPVINVSVAFEEEKGDDGGIISTEELESKFFDQKYEYIIVNKSKTGFTVVLNKKAEDDIYFTWTALQVKDEISLRDRGPN